MKRIVLSLTGIFLFSAVYADDKDLDCCSYIQYGGVKHCIASKDTGNDASSSATKEETRMIQRHSEVVSPFGKEVLPVEFRQEVFSAPPPVLLKKEGEAK